VRKRLLVTMAATMVLGLCSAGQASAYSRGDSVQHGCSHYVENLSNWEGACAILRYWGSDAGGPIYYFQVTASPGYPDPPVKLTNVWGQWWQWHNRWADEGNCAASSAETPYPQILSCSTALPLGPLHHCPRGTPYQIDVTVRTDSWQTGVETHPQGMWEYNNYCP
jgi:hypothetical protein